MLIEAVLFDFGGTLLEYHREEVMRALLESKGIRVSTGEVLSAYEVVEPTWNRHFSELEDDKQVTDETLRNLDRMIIEHLGVQVDIDNLSRYVLENWDRMDHQLPTDLVRNPFADARPCLETLAGMGYRMGVVSNIKSEERLREELLNIDLLRFFPVVVASGSVGIDKPARGIFDLAADMIGVKPECTIFVGDDLERDYYGAQGASMRPILIDRSGKYSSLTGLNRVSSLEQIPKLV